MLKSANTARLLRIIGVPLHPTWDENWKYILYLIYSIINQIMLKKYILYDCLEESLREDRIQSSKNVRPCRYTHLSWYIKVQLRYRPYWKEAQKYQSGELQSEALFLYLQHQLTVVDRNPKSSKNLLIMPFVNCLYPTQSGAIYARGTYVLLWLRWFNSRKIAHRS